MEMDMSEPQDDLTLVYMFGFRKGQDSMRDEIARLRAALSEIVEECQNTGYGDPTVMERMIDRIEETANFAMRERQND